MLLHVHRDHSIRTVTIRDRRFDFHTAPELVTLWQKCFSLLQTWTPQGTVRLKWTHKHTHTHTHTHSESRSERIQVPPAVPRCCVYQCKVPPFPRQTSSCLGRVHVAHLKHTHTSVTMQQSSLFFTRVEAAFKENSCWEKKERKEAFTLDGQICSILILIETPSRKKKGWDTQTPFICLCVSCERGLPWKIDRFTQPYKNILKSIPFIILTVCVFWPY